MSVQEMENGNYLGSQKENLVLEKDIHPKIIETDILFKEIDKYTSFKKDIVLWMGLRPGDYKTIDFIYPKGIIGIRFGKDTINIRKNYPIFSVEEKTNTRTDSSLEELEPYLKGIFKNYEGKNIHVIAYYSTNSLEKIASEFQNVNILNPPADLKTKLDQKNYARRELSKRGIKTIEGYETRINKNVFGEALKKYKLPFFVQLDIAWSGSGSFIIRDREDFNFILEKHKNEKAFIMKYIKGKSLNINAVRTQNYTIFSSLSFQIIGDPLCTTREFGYCGNDFNIKNKLNKKELEASREIIQRAGEWMGEQNYRGIFGIDLIADGKEVYFTEINPRFQGSTALLTDQQIENNQTPLTLFHLVPYLKGLSIVPSSLDKYNKLEGIVNCSQILLHNLTGKDCKLISSIEPGRYNVGKNGLEYLGPANFLSEIKNNEEIVVAGDIPLNGTKILNDSDEICRIYFKGESLGKDGRKLNEKSKKIVEEVYSKFIFKKV